MMKNDVLVIRNASFPLEKKFLKKDLVVKKGRIDGFYPPFSAEIKGARLIDASGLVCLPGLVDAHTHFKLKIGKNSYNSDDFSSGTRAALAGGITTVVDFTDQGQGVPFVVGLRKRLNDARISYCDYSFHCIVPPFSSMKNFSLEFSSALKAGISTFKIFTAYKSRGLKLEKEDIIRLLKEAAKKGAMVTVHAEKEELIEKNFLKLSKHIKQMGMKALPAVRNEESEISAVREIISLNEKIKAPLYFVHISSPVSAGIIEKASSRMPVRAETCPQYLVLNKDIYSRRNAYLYSFCPPSRSSKSSMAMWIALKRGALSVLATDSCGFSISVKRQWNGDINKLYMGISSSQFLLPLVYTFGVKKGLISMERLCELCCSNPALLMGIENKGFLKKGYYADLVLFDPQASFKISKKDLLNSCGYSVYEGMKVYGKVKKVFLRGRQVYSEGVFSPPSGRYIKRKSPILSSIL
ncbi:MAG: dihydropyrimidinase [Elusimicrobiota bacterium]